MESLALLQLFQTFTEYNIHITVVYNISQGLDEERDGDTIFAILFSHVTYRRCITDHVIDFFYYKDVLRH